MASPRRIFGHAHEESKHEECESFEFSIDSWVRVLDEYEVDKPARDALWLLAQDGKPGLEEAKHILMKIFKKTSDGDDLRKPSAFVSQCVKYAWHDLRPTTDRSKKRQSSSWNESPARCKKSRW